MAGRVRDFVRDDTVAHPKREARRRRQLRQALKDLERPSKDHQHTPLPLQGTTIAAGRVVQAWRQLKRPRSLEIAFD